MLQGFGCRIYAVARNLIPWKWTRHSGAPGAGSLAVHNPGTGIHDGRVDRGEVARPLCGRGDRRRKRLPGAKSEAFPTQEPECPLRATTRDAKRAACIRSELILDPGRPASSGCVEKIIICVENPIANVFIYFGMQGVGAAFCAQIGNSTRELPPFSSQVAGLDFELLN